MREDLLDLPLRRLLRDVFLLDISLRPFLLEAAERAEYTDGAGVPVFANQQSLPFTF